MFAGVGRSQGPSRTPMPTPWGLEPIRDGGSPGGWRVAGDVWCIRIALGRPRSRPGKANGADPKVDPTLTGAWSFPKKGAWRPVSLPLDRSRSGAVTGARTGIRFRPELGSALLGAEAPGRWSPRHQAVPRPIFRSGRLRWTAYAPAEALAVCRRGERPGKTGRWQRCFAFLSNDRPCLGPKSFAWTVSKTARTVAAISIGRQKLRTFKPLGWSVQRLSTPFRWLEGASRSRVAQARKPPLFHFPQFCLWTRVDKSTLRRAICDLAGRAAVNAAR